MSTPRRSALQLVLEADAAVDGVRRDGRAAPASGGELVAIWAASSRVGTSTRPRGPARPGLADPGDHERDAEGEGLARAGGGPAADVAAGEGVGDAWRPGWGTAR